MRLLPSALTALMLASSLAMAEDFIDIDAGRSSVGLALVSAPEYLGSEDHAEHVAPLLHLQFSGGRYLTLNGGRLEANLVESDTFSAGPVINRRAKRGDVEESAVDRMRNIDAATEGGLFGAFQTSLGQGSLRVLARYLKDASNTHDGSVAELEARYQQPVAADCQAGLLLGTSWGDHDYMNTYFGVNAEDSARSGLHTFDAASGSRDVRVSPYLSYDVAQDWTLLAAAQYQRLISHPSDSPVVKAGSADQLSVMAGALYHF